MTDSTKPTASKADAAPAEAEPDTGAAEPEQEAPADSAARDGEEATADLDETKRKFREALERKNHAHSDSQGQGGRDGSKISGAHGPAAARRNFRRKSG